MENKKFENGWREALEGAESAPSESVWSGVESDLIAAENQKMKKIIVLYQRLAAAAVLFAFLAGAMSYYYGRNFSGGPTSETLLTAQEHATNNDRSVTGSSATSDSIGNKKTAPNTKSSNQGESANKGSAEGATNGAIAADLNIKKQRASKSGSISIASSVEWSGKPGVSNSGNATDPALPGVSDLTSSEKSVVMLSTHDSTAQEADVIASAKVTSPLIQKPAEKMEVEGIKNNTSIVKKRSDRSKEMLWASVGASAGNYNPQMKTSYTPSANSLASSQSYNAHGGSTNSGKGTSYSAGVSVAGRVLSRFVLQAGVSYLNTSVGYTSNIVTADNVSANPKTLVADYAPTLATFVTSSSYELTSKMEFVSIPIQAGYLVIDKKLGWQFNAGVSPNFFVRNSLEDNAGQTETFSKGAGADSPYRNVNWTGLVSSELSYKLARQYRFSIVPGMRYSLNSSLKSGNDRPYMMDIGFRIRYILN